MILKNITSSIFQVPFEIRKYCENLHLKLTLVDARPIFKFLMFFFFNMGLCIVTVHWAQKFSSYYTHNIALIHWAQKFSSYTHNIALMSYAIPAQGSRFSSAHVCRRYG